MNSNYQEIIDDIIWAIEGGENEFSLTFVRCNYPQISQEIMTQLYDSCEINISQLILDSTTLNLYEAIDNFTKNKDIKSLVILGINEVININNLLLGANLQRERFRKDFQFPIIIWVNDIVLEKFNNLVKDFQTWAGIALQVDVNLDDLKDDFQEKIELLFQKIIEVGSAEFISNESILGINYQIELASIVTDIERLGENLETELQGSLEFIKGRSFYQENKFKNALDYYKSALNIYEESSNISPLKKAVLYFNIGLLRYRLSEKENQKYNLNKAQDFLENCLHIFEDENRDDLVAKFINCLGKILRELQQWEKLKILANKSLFLNEDNYLFLAEAYGFLTEVFLSECDYQEALKWIILAFNPLQLSLTEDDDDTTKSPFLEVKEVKEDSIADKFDFAKNSEFSPIYLLLLALVQENLGQHQEAIKSEEKAINLDVKKEERYYFLELLERLSNLYFQNQEYLASFKTKLNLKSFKQQYALIAFVGAGRIKATKKNLTNLSQEIASSGRQHDVDKIIKRIISIDNKITIIYGQSGVGKSSILEAGLIPTLKQQKYIGNNEILTINLRVYNNWEEELKNLLISSLNQESRSPLTPLKKGGNMRTEFLIEVLKNNDQNNITTILFFDQFEEFFFVTKNRKEVNEFFSFIAECLKIVYVKIVFSLREDYIYLLLQGTRHLSLNAINNDILSKNILYYLGNLSPSVTEDLITSLTKRCNLKLESQLIKQLVIDLTTQLQEVRPIELQIIGSQIQTEEITTLEQYNSYGISSEIRKEALVNNYLADVIKSCGTENEKVAKLVLSLLTNEKDNTRPLKTQLEIEEALEKMIVISSNSLEKKDNQIKVPLLKENLEESSNLRRSNLDLVLNIFVLSGLVMLIPEKPIDRYQLVHDYLIEVIKKQEWNSLSKRLKQAEAEKIKVQKRFNLFAVGTLTISFLLTTWAIISTLQLRHNQMMLLIESSRLYSNTKKESLDGVIYILQAKTKLLPWAKELSNQEITSALSESFDYIESTFFLREKNRLVANYSPMWSVAFSPDGKIIASGSEDGNIRLWNREGKLLHTLENYESEVRSLAFSPDGETLASASEEGHIRLWNREGKLVKTLKVPQSDVNSLIFSPNGEILASGSEDGYIRLWNKDGKLLQSFKVNESNVNSLTFTPDGEIIVSGSEDGYIRLWNKDGKLLQTLENHQSSVLSVVFAPDGEILASGSEDGNIRLWNKDGKLLQILEAHQSDVNSVIFSPHGKVLVSASEDQTIKLWSRNGQLLQTLNAYQSDVRNVAFAPDGQILASASNDGYIRLWHKENKLLQTLESHQSDVRNVAFAPDGEILASGNEDGTIIWWSREGKLLQTLEAHKSDVRSVVFSPDGQILASASEDKTIKLWNRDVQLLKTLEFNQSDVRSVIFSPDGGIFASGSEDGNIQLWNKEGKLLQTLESNQSPVLSLAFSPDGEIFASGSGDGNIRLWNREGKLLQIFKNYQSSELTFKVLSIAFLPDGKILASGSEDGNIRLWNREGKLLQILESHQSEVNSVAFSPDGTILASGSEDQTIKLWHLDLDNLVKKGCDWIDDYLTYSQELTEEERELCLEIGY